MTKITRLPESTNWTPEQVLEHAKTLDLESLVVLGFHKITDDVEILTSRKLTNKDALWLVEQARLDILRVQTDYSI